MTTLCLLAKFALVFLLLGAATFTRAADSCTAEAAKTLQSLNTDQIVSLIRSVSQLPRSQIKNAQSCLKLRGCYARDRNDIDGVVGPYTTAALYRSAYRVCSSTPPPPPDCGNGRRVVSYQLTKADIAALEAPPSPPAAQPSTEDDPTTAALGGITPPAEPPPPPPFSDDLKSGLAALQGADYPTRELFENALTYVTEQPVSDPKELDSVQKELAAHNQDIAQQACKAHSITSSGPGWGPDWHANMLYSLSDPVYAIFPFWLSDEPARQDREKQATPAEPHQVDFGVLERIGWFGITFSRRGTLNVQPLQQAKGKIERQIEMARRFRTQVDLVVYKRLSPDDWIEIAYENSDLFIQTLSKNIADTVGARLGGFLNRVQSWVMPGVLTSPSTAWDGVTLYFEGYPYGDPAAAQFLSRLLHRLRSDLNAKDPGRAGMNRHVLHLNLVAPYQVFVPSQPSSKPALVLTSLSETPGLDALVDLVPKHREDSTVNGRSETLESTIDNFLIFLPQPTTTTKKELRESVEEAFSRTVQRKRLLSENPDVSLAAWRFQMLRRIVYIISPSAWYYPEDYRTQGGQVFDDIVYAHDNFGAVGFWPLPAYDGNNKELASDIREVFQQQGSDALQRSVARICQNPTLCAVANFIGGWRRELFLGVEAVFFLVLVYFVSAFWIFGLREFYQAHQWWFAAVVLFNLLLLVLLCLFDRNLRDWAQLVFIGLFFLVVAALFARQYFLTTVEGNLP